MHEPYDTSIGVRLLELVVSECPEKPEWQVAYLVLRSLARMPDAGHPRQDTPDAGEIKYPSRAKLARVLGTCRKTVKGILAGLARGRTGVLLDPAVIQDREGDRTGSYKYHAYYTCEILTLVRKRLTQATRKVKQGTAKGKAWMASGSVRGNEGKKGADTWPSVMTYVFLLTFARPAPDGDRKGADKSKSPGGLRIEDSERFRKALVRQRGLSWSEIGRHFAALEKAGLLHRTRENGCRIYTLEIPRGEDPVKKIDQDRKRVLGKRKEAGPGIPPAGGLEAAVPVPGECRSIVKAPDDTLARHTDGDLAIPFDELLDRIRWHEARNTPGDEAEARRLAVIYVERWDGVSRLSDMTPYLSDVDRRRVAAILGELDDESGRAREALRAVLDGYASLEEASSGLGRKLETAELEFFTGRLEAIAALRPALPRGLLPAREGLHLVPSLPDDGTKGSAVLSGETCGENSTPFPITRTQKVAWLDELFGIYREIYEDVFEPSKANTTSKEQSRAAEAVIDYLLRSKWNFYSENEAEKEKIRRRLRMMIDLVARGATDDGGFGMALVRKRAAHLRGRAERRFP